MIKNRVWGVIILIVSIGFLITYGYFLFFTDYWILVLKITLFSIMLAVFGILAWIGMSMIETSNKVPLEQVRSEIEKEIFGGDEE